MRLKIIFDQELISFIFLFSLLGLAHLGFVMGNGPVKPFGEKASAIISKFSAPHKTSSNSAQTQTEQATFAAGCFWGLELAFQRVPGVISTRVGYTQGYTHNPSYEEVCSGTTGHTEAVQVTFNPIAVSYPELLDVFWDRLDPTTKNRQGNDVGTQYRSGIYFHSEAQKQSALASRAAEQFKYERPIVTEILPSSEFYPAEDYHQQYLSKGGQCPNKGDLSPIR
jgi:peptide-methionine (S)-S-oxide reductase